MNTIEFQRPEIRDRKGKTVHPAEKVIWDLRKSAVGYGVVVWRKPDDISHLVYGYWGNGRKFGEIIVALKSAKGVAHVKAKLAHIGRVNYEEKDEKGERLETIEINCEDLIIEPA